MAKRRRYDRVEPYRPPEPAHPAAPVRGTTRSHAKATDEPPSVETSRRRGTGRRRSARTPMGGASLSKANPEPVDVDGVAAITTGTVLWALAFLVLLPLRSRLADHGVDWWLWTCVAGVGMGLWGINYCRRRRDRLAVRTHRGEHH